MDPLTPDAASLTITGSAPMANMLLTQTQVAALLGISLPALWSLSGNGQFPTPVTNDDAGNVQWNSDDVDAFQALFVAACANWNIGVADYPAADWATLAASVPGPYAYAVTRGGLGSGAGLFD
jgi:predicted DNA-binding transcriptional regulator AlpA